MKDRKENMRSLTEKEKRKKHKEEVRAKQLLKVVELSGWDKKYTEEKMKHARTTRGVSFEHYLKYRFWELSEEEQKQYFCKGDSDFIQKKYNLDKEALRILRDKGLFMKKFEKFTGRSYMTTDELDFEEFKSKFENKKIIYKPRASFGGKGITTFEINDETLEDVYSFLVNSPEGVVEGYIEQHPEMKKLSANSVNTIRVVTVQSKDLENGKMQFAYACARMGRGNSCVDNMHSGGMVAGIDMETGEIVTDAADGKNHVYEKQPDTGVVMKGFKIPFFQEIKSMLEEAGKDMDGYYGWDIAIAEDGPVIIEANSRPEAGCLQIPYVPEKKGMRYVMEKYL